MHAVILPFLVGPKILDRGLDLDDPDLALFVSATRSARRPDGSGNSATQEKPSERNSRAVPRAIANAVSDWRRSGGGTRLIWRAGDSMSCKLSRFPPRRTPGLVRSSLGRTGRKFVHGTP